MPEAATAPAADAAPAATTRSAGIAGLGRALPARAVGNDAIAARLGIESRWIEQRTGIRSRRHLIDGERLADMAAAAGRAALEDAGITDVDMVVVATITADEITPGAAPLVAAQLGSRAAAFDINGACTGFLIGLDLAASMIESERADTVLLIGAEALSRLTDFDDRRTAGLFGDGAGAAVVAPGRGELRKMAIRSAGEHAPLIVADRDEAALRMQGHETFLVAVASLVEATRDAVAEAGLTLDDIDLFVYHQANRRILEAVAGRLEIGSERVVDAIADLGNTSAASIPLALAHAREEKRLHKGDKVLLGAVGAGFVYGAGVLVWG